MAKAKIQEIQITPAARIHDILTPMTILGGNYENIEVRRDALMDTVKIRALYDVVCTLVIEKNMALAMCNMNDKQGLNKLSKEYQDAIKQLMMLMDKSMGADVIRRIESQYDDMENHKKDIDSE